MGKIKKENRGRKPTEDPKELVRLYVNQSVIKKLGGVEAVKQMAYANIETKSRKV